MAGKPASDPALGLKLRQARSRKRLTLAQVAQALDVTPPWVNRWESGEHPPTSPQLRKLAELYEVSADWLLGRDAAEDFAREWPEGYNVMRRSASELSPEKRQAMLKIIETLIEAERAEREAARRVAESPQHYSP